MIEKFYKINSLKDYIQNNNYEFIVVCGYDNVGKGYVTNSLFEYIPVFHPDYSLICKQVPQSGRWSFFMYFLDLYSQLKSSIDIKFPLVFDRSSICGSVYNNDFTIAQEYSKKIRGINALHILVTVDNEESYQGLLNTRDNEAKANYNDYLVYTERYKCYMDIFNIDYVEFVNHYDLSMGEYLTKVCGGCSHYKSGRCVNPESGIDNVSFDTERCEVSSRKEVQDE